MQTRRVIAVLFHEKDRDQQSNGYVVHQLADYWREWGYSVRFIYGVQEFEPADLLFVHVDLSVVPTEYLEFASRYPVTVNGRVSDIRKSRISSNIVTADDEWKGPVIVKSDLNFGGAPESVRNRSYIETRWPLVRKLRSRFDRLRGTEVPFKSTKDYEIYDDLSSVPASRVSDQRLVIEKFLPECIDGVYYTRICQFLGDRLICIRMGSLDPIVKAHNSVSVENIEPHESIGTWRKELNIDYGKFDYVEVNGNTVLLDANKTIGASRSGMNQQIGSKQVAANRQTLAEGIYFYLKV